MVDAQAAEQRLAGEAREGVDAAELARPVAGVGGLGPEGDAAEVEALGREGAVRPEVVEVGLEEARELVEEVELGEQPGGADEAQGLGGVSEADGEGRVAAGLRRLRTGGRREVVGL